MNNELMHFGVLGMKWGIRKAEKQGKKYSYKSLDQKNYERRIKALNFDKKMGKKDANYDKKLKWYKENLKIYKQRDANRVSFAKSTSVGAEIARKLLLGPLSAYRYSDLRSVGYGKAASAAGSGVIPSMIMEISALEKMKRSK